MHNRYVHHGHMCQGQESMHRTCIQTSRSRMIHTLMHQSQGPGSQICASYTHRSESGIEDHRYVHHTHMQYSQGSRNIDRCIIHACIRIKDRGSQICVSYTHASESRIEEHYKCIIHACIRIMYPTPRIALFVGPSPKSFASWMHEPFVHHTCMNQGSRNIDTCMYQDQGSQIYASYTHACFRVKDRGTQIYASYTHASESRIEEHW